jgi:hypothetical protein
MNAIHSLRLFTAFALIAPLAACGGAQKAAEAAVKENLKDPDSARFGEFYYNKTTKKGCLTVNAKNSMGGYTGDQQAYVKPGDKGWEVNGISEVDQESCRRIYADANY